MERAGANMGDIVPFDDNQELTAREIERRVVQHALEIARPLAADHHIFSNRWLEEALELGEKPTETAAYEPWLFRRMRLIEGWKSEMLAQLGIHIENHHGKGYVVIAPENTAPVVRRLVRREFRKTIHQAKDKLELARTDGLSAKQKQERHDAYAYVGRVALAIEFARPKPPRPGQAKQDAE